MRTEGLRQFPKNEKPGVITIAGSAMETSEVDLNELLRCARRELAFRQRVYPKWIDKGMMTETKAERELELMRQLVDFLVHCVFKAVTRLKA